MTTALPRLFCWKSSWSSLSSSSFLSSPSSSSNEASNNSKNSIWSNTIPRTTCICRHRYHRAVNDFIRTWTTIVFSTHTTCSCLSSNADYCSTLENNGFATTAICHQHSYHRNHHRRRRRRRRCRCIGDGCDGRRSIYHMTFSSEYNARRGCNGTWMSEGDDCFHLWTITKSFKWLCRRKIMEGEIKDSNNVGTSW